MSRRARWETLGITAAAFLALWSLAALLTGQGLPGFDSFYNSYSLQADAWLKGRLDLGQDYEWLELAIRDGKYYVSFPPFPSLVMLPLVLIFGTNTPDTCVALLFALLALYHACAIGGRLLPERRGSVVLWVLFLLLGNGYLFLCLNGWVWFIAQNLMFALSLAAIHHALAGRGGLSLTCWAAAVGCRPMAVFCAPVLLWLLLRQGRAADPAFSLREMVRRRWYWALGPVLLAAFYMGLNQARFGNPLEFGHTYLPEFNQYGSQFSLSYLWPNLQTMLRGPAFDQAGRMRLHTVEGGSAWLVNPLLWTGLAAWIAGLRRRRGGASLALIPAVTLLYLLVVLCHRTLGAWQFGNRYLVDVMPWIWLGVLLHLPEETEPRFTAWNLPLMALGVALQFLGTVATYNAWI